MGAPAQVSLVEYTMMQRVLEHVTSAPVTGPVVLDFRRYRGPGEAPEPGPASSVSDVDPHDEVPDLQGGVDEAHAPLEVLKALALERARTEARLIEAAKDVVAATGAALLADKEFTSVAELSPAARKKWRAEAKATAVGEIQVLLGMGVTHARRLVGLATAPERTQVTVVGALARGEASLDMALRFWARCGSLPDDDGADVAEAMFGTDAASAAEERLDPQGDLKARPWHEGEYDAALEREARRREGKDTEAARERRRRARDERDATMRVHDDGTATLTIRCPLTTGAAIYQRVDGCSRSLRAAGDPRTLRQLRADVSSALLLHGVLPLPGRGKEGASASGESASGAGAAGDTDTDRATVQDVLDPALEDPSVDDLVTPAGLAEIARILSAAPPVQLQVVIPWDTLTGRPAGAAFCPAPCCRTTHGSPARQGSDPPAAAAQDRPHPPPGVTQGRSHPPPDSAQSAGRGSVGEIFGLPQAFVTPEHARVLAMGADTTLARLLTDPADGRLIERTIASYRPDAAMRRQVRAADVMSRMPGSRRPAAWCDIDHEHPFADGGPTSETNLNLKDRRPHTFKTKGWWRTTMAPNRDVTWTTLLGQTETTRCHDYRQYLDQRAPLDPDQAESHPSRRADLDDRLDLACQALYAALVHRDPHAHLADTDDHHGATEHDPSLGGWIWVSHTNPDGIRRYGPPTDHRTVAEILGLPAEESAPATGEDIGPATGEHTAPAADDDTVRDRMPNGPWTRRAADDDPPPF